MHRLARIGSLLLIAMGLFALIIGGFLFYSGFAARQALDQAEQQALRHAEDLARELAAIQSTIGGHEIQGLATSLLAAGVRSDEQLLRAVRAVGTGQPVSVQVFGPDLEALELGSYPDPDFTILEMLLQARRSGAAMPEAHGAGNLTPHLLMARRLDNDGLDPAIVLVRLPVESLVGRIDWADEFDYLALSQGLGEGRTELWQRGDRPGREPVRTPVADSRFWLEWHRATQVPAIGVRGVGITGLLGLVLVLLGVWLRMQAARPEWLAGRAGAADPAPGAAPSRQPIAAEPPGAEPPVAEPPVAEPIIEDLFADAAATPETPTTSVTAGTPTALHAPPASPPPEPVQKDMPGRPADDQAPASGSAELVQEAHAPEADADESQADESFADGAARDPDKQVVDRSMQLDGRLFTPAGILGRFDDGLDERSTALIGQAIGAIAAQRDIDRIAVARDGRLHGAMLLAALTRGLRASGIQVVDLGAAPVPLLDFAVLEMPGQAGVMVTGSHLPRAWNGLRIMLGGELIVGSDIRALYDRVRSGVAAFGNGELLEQSVTSRYCDAVAARIQLERPLKVVVDCANGVTGLVLPRLLAAIGADVIPLYADVDGSFPNHDPDPSRPDNLEDLRLCVRNFHADLGFALGGDGDRLVMVGSDSQVVWPDRLLMLLAGDLLKRQPGAVVVQDAMCSPRLASFVKSRGGQPIVSDLGTAAVWGALREQGAALGGTFSGQLFIAEDWNGASDALFAACRILEILAADTRDVEDLLAELPAWFSQAAMFVDTRPLSPEKVLDQLLKSADVNDAEVGSAHGFSIDYGHAWTRICRSADGTGLLVRFEGDDEAAAARLVSLVRQMLSLVDERLELPF